MKASKVSAPPISSTISSCLTGSPSTPDEAFQRHHGEIAILHRPRVDVDVLGLLLADFLEPLGDVLVGDFGIVVGHFDVLVFPQLDLRDHFELGLEAQRLALVEMDVLDIGRAHHVEVFGLELLLQVLGDQVFQHLLPDIAGELLANQRGGRLARPEARELGALLDVGDDAAGLAFHLVDRDGNFQRVPATFN